jgi:hypothetical protein
VPLLGWATKIGFLRIAVRRESVVLPTRLGVRFLRRVGGFSNWASAELTFSGDSLRIPHRAIKFGGWHEFRSPRYAEKTLRFRRDSCPEIWSLGPFEGQRDLIMVA